MPTSTGTLTAAAQTVDISNLRDSVIAVVVRGTYVAEMVFEGSLDGTNFFPVALASSESGAAVTATGILTNVTRGYYTIIPIRSVDTFRVRDLAHTSGTVNVEIRANKPLAEPAVLEEMVYGRKNVTTAGTAEILLSGSQETSTLTIQALEGNTGNIYVGDSAVDSTNGFPLSPGGSISLDHNHSLDNIYIDSDNNGEGVAFIGSVIME